VEDMEGRGGGVGLLPGFQVTPLWGDVACMCLREGLWFCCGGLSFLTQPPFVRISRWLDATYSSASPWHLRHSPLAEQ